MAWAEYREGSPPPPPPTKSFHCAWCCPQGHTDNGRSLMRPILQLSVNTWGGGRLPQRRGGGRAAEALGLELSAFWGAIPRTQAKQPTRPMTPKHEWSCMPRSPEWHNRKCANSREAMQHTLLWLDWRALVAGRKCTKCCGKSAQVLVMALNEVQRVAVGGGGVQRALSGSERGVEAARSRGKGQPALLGHSDNQHSPCAHPLPLADLVCLPAAIGCS